MDFIKTLTPENTEEIRPGLFVQKHKGKYRVVKPMAWDGELLIKDQLKSVFNLRTLFTILLIIFITWSYVNETGYCRELKVNPCPLLDDITKYCYETSVNTLRGDYEIDWDTITIQNNS